MSEPSPPKSKFGLNRTRLFIIFFFGLALLLSVTTILGTWSTERENAEAPPEQTGPAAN